MAGLVSVPNVDINFVPVKGGETFKLGPITCRVMEDGSNTGMRPPIPKSPPIRLKTTIPTNSQILTDTSQTTA